MIDLIYIPICILFAKINADWIKEGKKIKHFWNGLLHCVVAALVGYFVNWKDGLAVLFIANVFFNVSLNLFRKLPADYISPEVKSYTGLRMAFQKGKVIDYLEYKLFGNNGYSPKILYCFIIIILLTT